MNKTPIGWVKNPDGSQGYTWNPITGCLNGCPYCYARKLANGRLRTRYLANTNVPPFYQGVGDKLSNPFYPRFWEDRLPAPSPNKMLWKGVPIGVFVCDMSDLFGIGIPEEWTRRILETIQSQPWHRFYLLTKQPQNLIKFGPFPSNCWIGVSATNPQMFHEAELHLGEIVATVKYISVEPMLEQMWLAEVLGVDWVIIGSCTGTKQDMEALIARYPNLILLPYGNKWSAQPKMKWIDEIVGACDKAGIHVFEKDNLMPLMEYVFGRENYLSPVLTPDGDLRQEMPTTNV